MKKQNELNQLLSKIETLYKSGEYNNIIKLLNDDELNKYANAELILYKARAYAHIEELELSLKYANLAILADPMYGPGYRIRGYYNIRIGEQTTALIDLNKAIELDPNDKIAYCNRGYVFHELKEYEKAFMDYERAIKIDPNDDFAYGNRGAIWLDLNNYDNAIIDLNKAIELKTTNPISYYALSNAYKMKGNLQHALKNIEKAIQYSPGNAFYFSYKGEILFELEKFPEALHAYEKAVELAPNEYYKSLRDKAKARLGEGVAIVSNTNDNISNTASYIESLLFDLNENEKKSIRIAWTSVEDAIDRIRKLILYTGTEPVVHYTKIQVGDIMAANKDFKLRYSNVVFMNDPEEGDVFLEHLYDNEILEAFKRGDKKDDNNIYLGSFLPEDKSDYLIMWRTYGKNQQNEEATGCSFLIDSDFFGREGCSLYAEAGKIGPTKKIEEEKDLLHSQPLYKVIYYNRELKQLIPDGHDLVKLTKEIENFKSKLKTLIDLRSDLDDILEPKNGIIDGLVYRFISELRYFFKSAEYQFEKELRVIKYYPMESPKVLIDTTTTELPRKLYIESTKNLQEHLMLITLGPKVIHPERYMYLEALLKKNGHTNIQLKRSEKNYQ